MVSDTDDDWWKSKEYEIYQISCDDRGVSYLSARLVAEQWEYAVVDWQYRTPSLRILFRDGKVDP